MRQFIIRFITSFIAQLGLSIGAVLLLLGSLLPVAAHPPAGADMSYAPWYQSLMVPQNGTPSAGSPCCSVADCRPVRYRMTGDHYEAFIGADAFGEDAPNAWVSVPASAILRQMANPTGEGVLCYFAHQVRCFIPASGT